MITPVITSVHIGIYKDSCGWQCTVHEQEAGADDETWAVEYFAGVETKAEALSAARYAKQCYLDEHKDVVITWREERINNTDIVKEICNK